MAAGATLPGVARRLTRGRCHKVVIYIFSPILRTALLNHSYRSNASPPNMVHYIQ